MAKRKGKLIVTSMAVLSMIAFAALATACAPQSAATSSGSQQADPVAVSWAPDADCSVCHTGEAASQADAACIASNHPSLSCVDCHEADDALAAEHEGVTSEDKTPNRLKKTGIDETLCLSCHDDLAEKTAGFTGLVDANGTVANPHDLSESPDHDAIACSDCHSMHEPSANVLEAAELKCVSCHHEDVFECGTCHSR